MPEAVHAALPALFISDLHLNEDEPANVDAFLSFLAGPARQAASLFILGDLFEYWAGDDDLATPFNGRIAAAIRALADGGTAVFQGGAVRERGVVHGFARAVLPRPGGAAALSRTLIPDRPSRKRGLGQGLPSGAATTALQCHPAGVS